MSLEYAYCELFVKCYSIAKRTHEKERVAMHIDAWIFSKIREWGRIGNLARDCVDSIYNPTEKYRYCLRHYRHKKFKRDAFSFESNGAGRITLQLISHPCYCGFDKYVPLSELPDNWALITDAGYRHKMMKAASFSPMW